MLPPRVFHKPALPIFFALSALFCTMPQIAQAKTFRNAYVSFELPERWDCVLEQTEWVCRTNGAGGVGADNREAIIILTAKEVGPSDSLPIYMSHLKTARTILGRNGQQIQSQILKVEQRNIALQPWIDGMHLSSEVPNYYSRYLATTKDKIGILVTFSAHKLYYTKYSGDFIKAIESLRVVASKSNLNGGRGGGISLPGSETLGQNSGLDGMGNESGDIPEEGSGQSGFGGAATKILGFAFIIVAIGLYLYLKSGKKKKKPSSRPKSLK
jgi:hypothetical protein